MRNEARFNNKVITCRSVISSIITNTSVTGNHTHKASNNSITNFSILKSFKVDIHHSNAPSIIEVLWSPPLPDWTKCNTDGASVGIPGPSSCGGIFRDNEGNCLRVFFRTLTISQFLSGITMWGYESH